MDRSLVPRIMWMSADRVVETSLRAIERRKVICVPGTVNRFLALAIRSHLFDRFIGAAYGKRLKKGG